jgi:hypothetical protein
VTSFTWLAAVLLLAAGAPAPAAANAQGRSGTIAQDDAPASDAPDRNATQSDLDQAVPVDASAPQAPEPPATSAPPARAAAFIRRWLDLQNASLNLRFRYADNSAGRVTTRQLQHRETLRGRLKLDAPGRFAVNFGLFTGVRFTSGWDNTPWGLGAAQKNLAFKALYGSAQPVAGLEIQVGGLYIVKGESTELTTYDEDGYIMGERLMVRRPRQLFFDEISVTSAYFVGGTGDASVPVSSRFRHIDEPNYQHYLVDKKIGSRAAVSADYTLERHRRTWRQAVRVNVRELRLVDSIVFENYQRVRVGPDQGFAVTGEKALGRKLTLQGGYASIDPDYGGLNADRFNIGRRAFTMVIFNSGPITASFFVTTAVGQNGILPQRTLSNTAVSYNLLPALRRTGLFSP